MATVETKSFMKKKSFNWKNKHDHNLSDSGGLNASSKQPQNERDTTGVMGLND